MKTKHPYDSGFTIIELLIVIVVIGILAVITLIGYKNVTSRAAASSLQSDLSQNQQLIQTIAVQNSDQFPTSQAGATNGGVRSSGNTLTYRWVGGNNYCLLASNPSSPTTYYVTNTSTTPQAGTCPAVVNTFAGSLVASGYLDGVGTNAHFKDVFGITIDSKGNLYVSDYSDNRIRKITSDGTVSTFAGSGTQGLVNGAAGTAQFFYPAGLAVDSADSIYVADLGNNVIRKITQSGVVSTVAGTGIAGFKDGAATTVAQFNQPSGVVVDGSGNLYIADSVNYRVRKVDTSGNVTSYAGTGTRGSLDGPSANAQFAVAMTSVVLDSSGNVFVSTYGAIRKISTSGIVSTLIGYGANVQGPSGLAIDKSNNLYVTDYFSTSVYQVTPEGKDTRIAGNGTQAFADGLTSISSFMFPDGIVLDANGNIYVADTSKVDIILR